MFEQRSASAWLARHGLTDGPENVAGTLANANRWAKDNDCIVKTLTAYGTGAADRTYAGVWLPNPAGAKWQAHEMGDGNGYQFAALFTDDSVGAWVARHAMTADQYQAEFNTQMAAGRMPISVHGRGTGTGIRYAAVFANTDIPIGRLWTQTNSTGAGYTAIHNVMRAFMQKHGTRAGVLAVRKNGALRLASGYTWAGPGYAITQPNSLLRLASVSKAFARAAIQALVTDQGFNMNTRVFPYLGINTVALPTQTKDARIDNITVQQLVDHTGGWVRSVSGLDPVFAGRQIALALGLPARVTKRDVARYMYGEPLRP